MSILTVNAPARTSAPPSPRARTIRSPSRWRASEFRKELESGIRALRDGYKTSEHNVIEKGHNAALVDEYGLRDYLAERFAIVGTPEECRKRLEDMEKMGVTGLRINNALPDRTVFMNTWAKEVRGVA